MFRRKFATPAAPAPHGAGDGFSRMVAVSVILHLAIFAVALIVSRSPHKRLYFTPVYTVDLVAPPASRPTRVKKRSAPPAKVKKRVPPVKAKEKVKTVRTKKSPPLVKEDASLDSSLKKIQESVRKKEDHARLEERLARMRQEKAEEAARQERVEALRSEIRSSAERTTPTVGVAGSVKREQADLRFKAYYQQVSERIRSFWVYTGPVIEGDMTVVTISIDDSGRVVERWVERGSRTAALNEAALNTVDMATKDNPLPPPREGMEREISLRFCSAECPE